MSIELKIPEAGESISEVQIGEWRKSEGDPVERDEVLVEIETDKASMELPAPVSGTIEEILKKPGEIVGVGEVIARINEGDGRSTATPTTRRKPAREAEQSTGRKTAKPPQTPAPSVQAAAQAEEMPAAEEESENVEEEADTVERPAARVHAAEKHRAAAAKQQDSPAAGPAVEEEEEEELETEEEEEEEDEDLEIEIQPRVMPAAKRALAEYGLKADEVRGTGPGGRVLKDDVLRHVAAAGKGKPDRATGRAGRPTKTHTAQGAAAHETAPTAQRAVAHDGGAPPSATTDPRDTVTPMTMLRRRVAERLVDAQQTAALLTTFNELDMSEVLRLRKQSGEAFQERHGVKLGFMSFFVKAAVDALKAIPQVNAEIRGTDIVYHKYHDVGVAVSTEQGLVVPVLRDADRMSFAEIEKAIEDLARRARERRVSVEELRGGTFTITNGGVFGSLLSTPIVNPPQSAILGLHAIQDRPVAREGQIVIRPMMYIALTYDHRLIDGREAVLFLRHIKDSVESPVRMLLSL
jgi:2-oxoglutarate dehydrogenase E2 component (dihydrolipoamide succinyltransferase)